MKIQWHTGFASAIELKLAENKADLIYEREHNLNKKPLEIDLLVIKKEDKTQVKNKIIRQVKPVRLFQYFTDHNIQLTNPYNGIYYVMDNVLFPTQIIVTKELNPKEPLWLSALSGGMQKQQMKALLEKIEGFDTKFERELADSVLEVTVRANWQIVQELRGDEHMCQALLELMEPEINKIKKEAEEEAQRKGMQKGIKGTVTALRDCGQNEEAIKEAIVRVYNLSSEEAERYL